MRLFLDSSALVKRYVKEDGAQLIRRAMSEADSWVASQITFVETLRVVSRQPDAARSAKSDWARFEIIGVSQPICERAIEIAGDYGLKSLDAIQLASALTAGSNYFTFAAFDRKLHAAAQAEGLETLPAALS